MRLYFAVEKLWDEINGKLLPNWFGDFIYFIVLLFYDWRYARNWYAHYLIVGLLW